MTSPESSHWRRRLNSEFGEQPGPTWGPDAERGSDLCYGFDVPKLKTSAWDAPRAVQHRGYHLVSLDRTSDDSAAVPRVETMCGYDVRVQKQALRLMAFLLDMTLHTGLLAGE